MTQKEQQLREAMKKGDFTFVMLQIQEAFKDGAVHQVPSEEYIFNKYYA